MNIPTAIASLNKDIQVQWLEPKSTYNFKIDNFPFSLIIEEHETNNGGKEWYVHGPLHEQSGNCPVCENQVIQGRVCYSYLTEETPSIFILIEISFNALIKKTKRKRIESTVAERILKPIIL